MMDDLLELVWDFNRHVALVIGRTPKKVRYIPLVTHEHLRVHELPIARFNTEYKPVLNYDPTKALVRFQTMGEKYGASAEVRDILGLPESTTEAEASKPVVKGRDRKLTMKAMCHDLFLEDKWSDLEIFEQLMMAFDLGPEKKRYVGIYRKQLTNEGHTLPPPRGETYYD
jgi:hypothetical protein